jgi:hypothetical protein
MNEELKKLLEEILEKLDTIETDISNLEHRLTCKDC